MLRLMNLMDKIRFRIKQGYWCKHTSFVNPIFIHNGMGKMTSCKDCGMTKVQ